MDCPKCKYPNKAGTRYCGMCYEVLTHSAAESYMRTVRRERQEGKRPDSSANESARPMKSVAATTKEVVKLVDWAALQQRAIDGLIRYRKVWIGAALLMAGLFIVQGLISPETWFKILGARPFYAVTAKDPQYYMVGTRYDLNLWSERQGRLDTPIQHLRIDEIGNFRLEKTGAGAEKEQLLGIQAKEWIQISYHGDTRESQSIALSHPSLAPVSAVLDRQGSLLKRNLTPSPRLSKSACFLLLSFPKGRLKRGHHWKEPIEWMDTIGDWKIHWTGQLHWTLKGMVDCGADSCMQFQYKADLQPQIWAAPSWATRKIGRPSSFKGNTQGEVLFNTKKKRLYANALNYGGILRIPISDVGAIPMALRIGRRVESPGELVLQLSNRIEIK